MINPRKIDLSKRNYKFQEEDPDIVHHFIEENGSIPSLYKANGPFLYEEAIEIITKFGTKAGFEIHKDWEFIDEYFQAASYRIKTKSGHTIFVKTKRSFVTEETSYVFDKKKNKYKHPIWGWIVTSEVELYYDLSQGRPQELISTLEKTALVSNIDSNKIHLICQNSDGFYTKEFPVMKDDFEFDLDLHYGAGFSEYHETNLKRINTSKKGIILLHGEPGTGKSTILRRMIRDLAQSTKKVLYMPSNIIDFLGTPAFNNFLIEFIEDSVEEADIKKGILIILEDAERVLLKRETNPYGSDGVSNILNSTDGILNDFFPIQILATFNTGLENIDTAILRKQRIISVKEFKKLSIGESQKLIDHLKIDYKATQEMSLADIYSIPQEQEDDILVGKKKVEKTIGFGFGDAGPK